MDSRRNRRVASVAIACAVVMATGGVLAAEQSGESKNMTLLGHDTLQGRNAYQPNVIRYPDGRYMLFVGTHGGSAPNPLNGGVVEPNGTMIVDVTDPKKP